MQLVQFLKTDGAVDLNMYLDVFMQSACCDVFFLNSFLLIVQESNNTIKCPVRITSSFVSGCVAAFLKC
jgi:hypothetical protein